MTTSFQLDAGIVELEFNRGGCVTLRGPSNLALKSTDYFKQHCDGGWGEANEGCASHLAGKRFGPDCLVGLSAELHAERDRKPDEA